jgi:hypothetical protein
VAVFQITTFDIEFIINPMKYILLLLSFVCLFLTSGQAQWTNDTTLNTEVRDTAGVLSPLCASISNGSTYICWYEFAGSNLELRMQLLDANGIKQWGPRGIVVSNYPQTTSTSVYDLKTDHEGNAIVAFQDIRSGNLQVVAYKIDVNGILLWGSAGIALVDSNSTQGIAPSIGISAQNDVYIAWNSDDGSKRWIDCHRISSSGVPQWNSHYLMKDTVGSLNFYNPSLIPTGVNDILMLFDQNTSGFYGVMYVQKISATGTSVWTSPKQVSTKSIAGYYFPKTLSDNAGGFYVSWDTSNPISLSLGDVYVQHVDSSGNMWNTTGIEAANSTTTFKSTSSNCYVSSSGEFWVLLKIQDNSQAMSGVSVQKFDAAGNVLLGANGTDVIPVDPIYFDPQTIDDAGNGVIINVLYGTQPGPQRLKAIKLDYTGMPVWASTTVSMCAVASNKDEVQTGDFINNNLVLVWQDDRNGSGVFAQNITGDGLTGLTTEIKNPAIETLLTISPNPSSYPIIFFSDNSEKTIVIHSIEGKKTAEFTINETYKAELTDLAVISNGLYFITIKEKGKQQTIKWTKN